MDFSAFDTQKMERYAAEAKKQWQNTSAYQAFAEKSKGRSKEAGEALGRGLMKKSIYNILRTGKAVSLSAQTALLYPQGRQE